jgi:RND family efflux transporter MFP subunit
MSESNPTQPARRHRLRTIGIFVGVVALGIGIFILLLKTKPEPKKQAKETQPTVVDVEVVAEESRPVTVVAMGTVVPARQVTVSPEVSGRLVFQSPSLVPGGRFAKGQVLAQIDPRVYDLAVREQRAAVAQAGMSLAQERSLKQVADREWSLIADEVQPTEEGRKLARREIQLEVAHAAADAARSQLELAKLKRERTALRAPFNAVVVEKMVDAGQVVTPGTPVATLADSDCYWVRVSLPADELKWVRIPGVNATEGSPATVEVKLGGTEVVEHKGTVVQLYPDLDPKGMMARILVEVRQPLGKTAGLPLLLGSFATVRIRGAALERVASIPRGALHDNERVWVMGEEDTLEIRAVEVVWGEAERVFVAGDLEPGERAVVSRIAVPVVGMALRLNGNGNGHGEVDTAAAMRGDPGPDPSEVGEASEATEEAPL